MIRYDNLEDMSDKFVTGNKPKRYTGRGGNHGGGRPSKENAKRTTISICGSLYEIQSIKDKAKVANKTVSRYVIDSLLESLS